VVSSASEPVSVVDVPIVDTHDVDAVPIVSPSVTVIVVEDAVCVQSSAAATEDAVPCGQGASYDESIATITEPVDPTALPSPVQSESVEPSVSVDQGHVENDDAVEPPDAAESNDNNSGCSGGGGGGAMLFPFPLQGQSYESFETILQPETNTMRLPTDIVRLIAHMSQVIQTQNQYIAALQQSCVQHQMYHQEVVRTTLGYGNAFNTSHLIGMQSALHLPDLYTRQTEFQSYLESVGMGSVWQSNAAEASNTQTVTMQEMAKRAVAQQLYEQQAQLLHQLYPSQQPHQMTQTTRSSADGGQPAAAETIALLAADVTAAAKDAPTGGMAQSQQTAMSSPPPGMPYVQQQLQQYSQQHHQQYSQPAPPPHQPQHQPPHQPAHQPAHQLQPHQQPQHQPQPQLRRQAVQPHTSSTFPTHHASSTAQGAPVRASQQQRQTRSSHPPLPMMHVRLLRTTQHNKPS